MDYSCLQSKYHIVPAVNLLTVISRSTVHILDNSKYERIDFDEMTKTKIHKQQAPNMKIIQ